MRNNSIFKIVIVFIPFMITTLFAGISGKLTGKVYEADTEAPLIGANVIIAGSTMGAATDLNGNFVILNIPPGTYDVIVTMMGYTRYQASDVRIEIDLTTQLDISLSQEIIMGQTVVVEAGRKPIKMDVAASQTSVPAEQIEEMPVTNVSEIIGLKAGIQGFSIRGGGTDQTMLMVDGLILNDERNNQPNTFIPLSAISDISVQTGGFNAEYNNVRSGVVNVVTRSGSLTGYSGTITIKHSPASQKHFGLSPYDASSYFLRPYMDDEVCWTGTSGSGAWDEYTQRQYAQFEGWNSIAAQSLADDNPDNDLTPEGARKLFTWEHRKNGAIDKPDFVIDGGFGGPVPIIGQMLGNLRFFLSHKKNQEMYLYQVSRPALNTSTSMLKLTSDLSSAIRFTFTGMYGEVDATTISRGGGTSYMNDVWDLAGSVDRDGFTMPWRLYTDNYWSPTKIFQNALSMRLTHQLSQRTYYEVLFQRSHKYYHTWHDRRRNFDPIYEVFPTWYADEAPVGFSGLSSYSVEGSLAFGGAISTSRDTSRITTYTFRGDLTSQITTNHELKTGFNLVVNNLNMEFGSRNEFLPGGNYWSSVDQQPYRFNIYAQDKLEYKGFIASAGLVLDFINPNGDWYVVSPYDASFFSTSYDPNLENEFPVEKIKPNLTLSPRLAVSHPITENSKLYFNYGHYRQMPLAQDLYRVRRGPANEVYNLGDPNLPLAKTISYELGFDQVLMEIYRLHLSTYYKDVTDQQDYTDYISADSKSNYSQLTSNSYEDIRGFEFEVAKAAGDWVTGFVNAEYRVNSYGHFGVDTYFENPSEQRDYERRNIPQSKPKPIPRVKSVIDFHVPDDFRVNLLRGIHLNTTTRWQAGLWFTYNPGQVQGVEYNMQYRDQLTLNLKLSKIFTIGRAKIKIFADINNALNTKIFSGYGFIDGFDYSYYMESLLVPDKIREEIGLKTFPRIDKNDRPGDYRENDVDFVPLEWVGDVNGLSEPSERPIYYDYASDSYLQYTSADGWQAVDQGFFDDVLEDKAYIDMPNQSGYVFLNPRDIYFGLTISYDF